MTAFEDVAKSLITALGGEITDKNISGVVDVFNGISRGVNNQWEKHLAKESEEVIAYDKIKCSCGNKIQIIRTRQKVDVEIVQ